MRLFSSLKSDIVLSQASQNRTVHMYFRTVLTYFGTVRWYFWRARLMSDARCVIRKDTRYLRRNLCKTYQIIRTGIHKRSSSKIATYIGPPIVRGSARELEPSARNQNQTPPQDPDRYPVGDRSSCRSVRILDKRCMQHPRLLVLKNENRTTQNI